MANNRYHSLDFLKFILTILILFHHFQQMTEIRFEHFNFFDGNINIAFVVEFFFIISGFVSYKKITTIKDQTLGEYFKRIITRLFPMATLSTLFLVIISTIDYLMHGTWRYGVKVDLFKVLNSFLLTFDGGALKVGRGINNPLWYVCVLLTCYAVLFAIIKYCKKHNYDERLFFIGMMLLGIGGYLYQFNLPYLNEASSRGYSTFFFGILLAYLYETCSKKIIHNLSRILLVIFTGLAIFDFYSFFHYEWGALTFVYFPVVLFTFLGLESALQTKIKFKGLGKIIYEMYVWHYPIIFVADMLGLFTIFKQYPMVSMLAFSIFVFIFASFMCYVMEERVTKMFTKLIYLLVTKE